MTEEKKEVPSDFELMDREDEEQILAELRGVPVDKFIYKNSRGQFELSYAGTKWAVREMANQGEAIRIDGHPKIERCVIDPEYITVTILAKRVKVDREARAETLLDTTLGSARGWIKQKLNDGRVIPDEHFFTKTVSKATRNVQQSLMPQDFKKEIIEALKAMLVEEGSSVVVYAWHRQVYEVMSRKLEDLKPVMITGAESTKEKISAKKKFVEGEMKVLFISLRAGAGIDGLQKVSNTVVFAELDWSPGAMEQCTGRVFRDGQPDPVTAFFLVTEEGSDPTMSQALGLKTEQVEGIRNPDKELVETLQVDEDRIRTLAKNYLAKNRAKAEMAEEEEEPQEAESEA